MSETPLPDPALRAPRSALQRSDAEALQRSDAEKLVDTYGRVHNNLRISVTDRCNLRCTYCMPEEVVFMDKGELLTFEEITRFVRVAAPLGIDKLRLTGGEPLMRRDLERLVAMLAEVPGIKDIGLTTNGILLAEQARSLRAAGLHRINVSLDTLDPERFRQVSRRDGLDKVLAGITAAKAAGFDPVKVNAVIIRGVTDVDVVPLAIFAREHGLEMRYIEYMPIGAEAWERGKVFFAHEILEQLEREVGPLVPAEDYDPRAPAMDFRYTDGRGKVGIIASVSRPFCMSCNRLRLTADGKIRNCLFALDEADVKNHLRGKPDDAALAEVIRSNVRAKWEGHEINTARFIKPQRTMHAIGG
jgi:GTP 3',8-cyclase